MNQIVLLLTLLLSLVACNKDKPRQPSAKDLANLTDAELLEKYGAGAVIDRQKDKGPDYTLEGDRAQRDEDRKRREVEEIDERYARREANLAKLSPKDRADALFLECLGLCMQNKKAHGDYSDEVDVNSFAAYTLAENDCKRRCNANFPPAK